MSDLNVGGDKADLRIVMVVITTGVSLWLCSGTRQSLPELRLAADLHFTNEEDSQHLLKLRTKRFPRLFQRGFTLNSKL